LLTCLLDGAICGPSRSGVMIPVDDGWVCRLRPCGRCIVRSQIHGITPVSELPT
jgi:hypothetical protein